MLGRTRAYPPFCSRIRAWSVAIGTAPNESSGAAWLTASSHYLYLPGGHVGRQWVVKMGRVSRTGQVVAI
jgi:hypothetical protein